MNYIIIFFILILVLIFISNLRYKENKFCGGEKYRAYNNSMWIYNNFYSENDFNKIQMYCSKLNLKNDRKIDSRLSLCLNKNKHKKLYNLIYNKKLINFINKIKDNNLYLKATPSYPIEYRKYFNGSKGLSWHKDTSLFYPDAFEIVLTLRNNSDSKFLWENDNKIKSINPKANTLVIVKPMTVRHSVSDVNIGERTILKFVAEFNYIGKKNNIKKSTFSEELKNCEFD